MAKRRRLKKKYRIILRRIKRLITLLLLVFIIYYLFKIFHKNNYIDSIDYENNYIVIKTYEKYDNLSCLLSNNKPDNNSKWINVENNTCKVKYIDNSNIYIKDNDKITNNTKSKIFYQYKEDKTVYIALNSQYDPFIYLIGDINQISYTNYDTSIISIENNKIKGIKTGNTKLTININGDIHNTNITVTSLLVDRPKEYDNKKEYLICNRYSEKENDEFDLILKNKIDNVGYQTRAGVVEAARFLTLDFPYKINYFYENGRQTTNNVDGEGRYYHEGLYLNSTRYKKLTGFTTMNNRGSWGCSLYSTPVKKNIDNGLDCSGFVSWALLNGGFDVKDIGAGWDDAEDLTDYGDVRKIEIDTLDQIKVGDLLHSDALGGHIAIIIGIDENNFYVAQALWEKTIGVVITKYKKEELKSSFPHVILMDKYYKNDGDITNMWY